MKKLKKIKILLLLVVLSMTLVACNSNTNTNVAEDLTTSATTGDFIPVKPSEIGTRDYWELVQTFNLLSVDFINALYSKDNEKIEELANPDIYLGVEVEEPLNVNHIKQQTVLYDEGKYNCIMQFGVENETYRYFHIFFEDTADEWKICDVQMDA